jgi:organic radical activating enzyme
MLPLMEELHNSREGFHTGTAAYFVRIGGCDVGCHVMLKKAGMPLYIRPSVDLVVANASKYAETVVVTEETINVDMTLLTQMLKDNNRKVHIETS